MIGRVLAIAGSQMTIDGNEVDQRLGPGRFARQGHQRGPRGRRQRERVEGRSQRRIGPPRRRRPLGRALYANGRGRQFSLGVSGHPVPGESVVMASDADLRAIYGEPSQSNVRVGTLYRDAKHPAYVLTDELVASTSPFWAPPVPANRAPSRSSCRRSWKVTAKPT